ncbi:phosphomannomutase/phosphoglucomutase [Candidatus Saccharibacteria bacterium]|nr:phosphomannomutase/phosphoglucomutase [Candidatus Saccharibacteria bacterium]
MKVDVSIFKAYDVRGKVGDELNEPVIERIGHAFGLWLPAKGVVAVGRDMRPDSAAFTEAIIRGLTAAGRDVIDIGQVTSDMIYFATGSLGLAGGVMITASHNPAEYNGIKFCREEAKPVGIETGLQQVRDLVVSEAPLDPATQTGTVTHKELSEAWIQHVLSFINADSLKPLKLVVDAGNGMAGKIFPEIEPYVPFDVTEMFFELDGSFPNHVANPIEAANIADLIAKVQSEKADVGLAFDADGDRAVLIDEKGQALSGTVMTALLARYFLGIHPGVTILYNATCGWVVPETIEAHGGKGVRTKVGHSFIKDDMRRYDATFAGESSAHYYFRDNFMADSGLIAAMVGLAVLSDSGKKLSELADEFRKYHHITETNFTVEDKEKVIAAIKATFADAKQDELDGLTVWLDNAWCNIRPSNTESILRLNAEAKDQATLDNLVAKVTAVITA